MEVTRHFTVTMYIIFRDKVLLHEHLKLNLILPVGGHIDRDELPHEAALREAREEAGLEVELYNSNKLDENHFYESIELNRGEHLNLHKINEFHEHVDFVFYGKAKTGDLNPEKGESKKLMWFSREEIESSSYIREEIKTYALEALGIFGEEKKSY
ncbi:MAG: NUDIX domain-containing protein [Nanoarchaeota archaeon]|nr:NUDIX domain-containing protein [Nanoarchaeota archaeon]